MSHLDPMEDHIGIKIKKARRAKGITQEKLAEMIHKTRPLVSYIEQTGKVHPNTLLAIINCLDMSTADIQEVKEHLPGYGVDRPEMDTLVQKLIESFEREIETLKKHIALQEELIRLLRREE